MRRKYIRYPSTYRQHLNTTGRMFLPWRVRGDRSYGAPLTHFYETPYIYVNDPDYYAPYRCAEMGGVWNTYTDSVHGAGCYVCAGQSVDGLDSGEWVLRNAAIIDPEHACRIGARPINGVCPSGFTFTPNSGGGICFPTDHSLAVRRGPAVNILV